MSQPIRLASLMAPAAGSFEQPFEMLDACHERVHRMLALLQRLREHVAVHGVDEQARQAARDVMRYFDEAAPRHHRDEELHVFPPLLAEGDPDTVTVVIRLQQDHLQMESRWAQGGALLLALTEGRLARFTPADNAVLDAFAALYGGHIEAEEKIAYPRARALLDAQALQAMSLDMMQRRGLR